MIGRNWDYVITEHPLPTEVGEFKLRLSNQRQILSIQQIEPGKPILVVREIEDLVGGREESFRLVESQQTFSLEARFPDTTEILGSFVAGGKLLHLIGVRTAASLGGAC